MAMLLTLETICSFVFWSLLLAVASYCVLYYLIYLRQTKRWKQSNIPFLPPAFLIGHKYFFRAGKYSVSVPLDQIYKENKEKKLVGIFMGVLPMILVKDHKLIRQVFIKNSSRTFTTGFGMPENEVEYQFMITLTQNESRWKFGRTTLMPTFSANSYRGPMFETIKKAVQEIWHSIEEVETEGSPLNVKEITDNAVLNIASSAFFGIDSNCHAMKQGVRTIIKGIFEPSYSKVINSLMISLCPSLQKFEFFQLIPRKCCSTMSEILKYQINQRDEKNIEIGDFIDILRSLRNKQEPKNNWNTDSDVLSISEGLNIRQMTGLGLGLLAASTESTSELLNFVIHALSLYPEYQCKIRKEVYDALKKQGVSELDFEVVQSLNFTFQCLFETTRLYPVAPFTMKQCSEDFQIPGMNYIFRKGDRVVIPLYSMARDEEEFKDPHSFNPERFNSKSADLNAPGTLLSFGIGPRKCPGYQTGVFVAAAILASIVYKYEIKPRSHLKLMDAKDFHPKGFLTSPRTEIFVDLVRCESLGDV